jgi:HK97 family phage prohead protease
MAHAMTVAREGLVRQVPFTLLERDSSDGETGDGLTLEGHAAVFNSPTLIDSWEGRFVEQIAPGAFKKTFRERTPVMQFDHGHHPLIGSIPIGRYQDVHEDDIGAYCRGRLLDNWLVQPVREAIAERAVKGMSFRFTVVRDEWRDKDGKLLKNDEDILQLLYSPAEDEPVRTHKELKVPEMGPVVFPAYEETEVGVRSGRTVIDLGELRDNPEARKTLARTLFLAERTTLSVSNDDGTPEETPPPASSSEGTPQGDNPAPASTPEPEDRTAALAVWMRARLETLTKG